LKNGKNTNILRTHLNTYSQRVQSFTPPRVLDYFFHISAHYSEKFARYVPVFTRASTLPTGNDRCGGVRQDKGMPKCERVASMQPAPPKNVTRERHLLALEFPRSQKLLLPNSCAILAQNMLFLL
jgi:hypothetical protein